MRLINDQLKRELPSIGSQADKAETELFVGALFFSPLSPAKWLILEYGAEQNIVFCFADLFGGGYATGAEFGYTSVDELESTFFGPIPAVVRDEDFVPMPFLECIDSEGHILA